MPSAEDQGQPGGIVQHVQHQERARPAGPVVDGAEPRPRAGRGRVRTGPMAIPDGRRRSISLSLILSAGAACPDLSRTRCKRLERIADRRNNGVFPQPEPSRSYPMRSEVTVTFEGAAPVRMDLDRLEPMSHEEARAGWTGNSPNWVASQCGPPARCSRPTRWWWWPRRRARRSSRKPVGPRNLPAPQRAAGQAGGPRRRGPLTISY